MIAGPENGSPGTRLPVLNTDAQPPPISPGAAARPERDPMTRKRPRTLSDLAKFPYIACKLAVPSPRASAA